MFKYRVKKLLSKRFKIFSVICVILSADISIPLNAESAQYRTYRRYYKPPAKPRYFPPNSQLRRNTTIKPQLKNTNSRYNKPVINSLIPATALAVPALLPNTSATLTPLQEEQKLIEEKVNNLDKTLNESKKDIVSSTEKINNLKVQQNEILAKNKELNERNNSLYTLVKSLLGLLLLSLAGFLFALYKIKENSKKTIEEIRNQQINNVDQIVSERVNDFDNALKDNFDLFSQKIENNNKTSISDFEKQLSVTIDKYMKNYLSKIDDENNSPEALEVKRYINNISDKEKEIASKIERIHIANTYFNTANTLMKSKYYEDAIDEYKESIKANPGFYGAYLNLGKAYEKIKENDKAINTYKDAINLKPDYFKAYYNLASIYLQLKDYKNAEENYEQVLKLKPDNYKAYNNLAIINNLNGNKEKAKEYYKKALEYNREYVEAYFNLVMLEAESEKDSKEENNIYHIIALYTKKYGASTEVTEKVEKLIENHLKKKEIVKK